MQNLADQTYHFCQCLIDPQVFCRMAGNVLPPVFRGVRAETLPPCLCKIAKLGLHGGLFLRVVHGSRSTSIVKTVHPVKGLSITYSYYIWYDVATTLCFEFYNLPRSKSFHRGCRSFSKDLGCRTSGGTTPSTQSPSLSTHEIVCLF